MRRRNPKVARRGRWRGRGFAVAIEDPLCAWRRGADVEADRRHLPRLFAGHPDRQRPAAQDRFEKSRQWRRPGLDHRSEEHTSELQSLMRISYAVFCLQQKKLTKHYDTLHYTSAESR